MVVALCVPFHRQGIKFYDPEIVGDTPETVEFRGMQHLVNAVRPRLGLTAGLAVFDPTNKEVRLCCSLLSAFHCSWACTDGSSIWSARRCRDGRSQRVAVCSFTQRYGTVRV